MVHKNRERVCEATAGRTVEEIRCRSQNKFETGTGAV